MKWRPMVLCAAFLAGSIGYGAEQLKIKGDDGNSLEFSGNQLYLANESGRQQLMIGKLFYTWSPQVAVPASAEAVGTDSMKIDYTIRLDGDKKRTPEQTAKASAAAESIHLSALCTLKGGRLKMVFTLDSPQVKPDGVMVEIVGKNGVSKQGKYDSVLWKLRPFGGRMAAQKEGTFRSFRSGKFAAWLKLPGNSGWTSSWAEHAGFKAQGDGRYTTEFLFVMTPLDFSGADVAAAARGDQFSLAFEGRELVVRNLGYNAARHLELSLNGNVETVSFEPGEVKRFPTGAGEEATMSATLKVGEKLYAVQDKAK